MFASAQRSLARLFEPYSDRDLAVIADFLGRNAQRLRAETAKLDPAGRKKATYCKVLASPMCRVDMSNSRYAVRRVEFLHISGAHMSYGLGTLLQKSLSGTIRQPRRTCHAPTDAWGMLVDKFGTPWIVNGELLPI